MSFSRYTKWKYDPNRINGWKYKPQGFFVDKFFGSLIKQANKKELWILQSMKEAYIAKGGFTPAEVQFLEDYRKLFEERLSKKCQKEGKTCPKA